MKILIVLLVISICALDVKLSDQCTCTQLQSKGDCTQNNCTWNSTKNECENKKTDESTSNYPISQLCANIKQEIEKDCPITIGCGYNDQTKTCEQFSGCSAYNKQTNEECQKASKLCTSDGKNCIDPLKCEEYIDQILCTKNISTTGTKYCKWSETDKKCQDQICTDAPDTITTDVQCKRFLNGCVTTGKGCISILELCSTYQLGNCLNRIGSDGYCYEKDGTCQRIPCTDAPEYQHDKQCEKFQKGCISTGRGCVDPPLQECSTYKAITAKCLQLIGSDGKCEGTPDQEQCRIRICESATETTNEACNLYKTGCLTNGVKCVTKLELCSTYTDNCDNRIGSDGNCKIGITDKCEVRLCSDASNKLQTDKECETFQKGCITSGFGCVTSRKNCDKYNGTKQTCNSIVGSDGRCKGQDETIEQPCQLAKCIDAPIEYKTHSQCQIFQSNCLSNGAGCEEQTTCSNTISKFACEGTNNCQWNQVCVTAKCEKYTVKSLCESNLEDNKPCFWTGSGCRLLECSDAPKTYKTNEECDQFYKGCRTNLNGCKNPLDPCSSYEGLEDQCKTFIGNGLLCWGIGAVKQPCVDRLCSMDTVSTTDQDCQKFQVGCLTNGAGCISKTESCIQYIGDQTKCSKFIGSDGKCYNDVNANSNCRVLVCTDNTIAVNDDECNKFLNNCVYSGAGCIQKTEPCTSYTGDSTDKCSKFHSNGEQCWWESGTNCVLKLCSHNTTATTDSDCNTFLKDCVTNGNGCQHLLLECDTYSGTEQTCILFKGNNKSCTLYNQCTQKYCIDVQSPTQQSDCINYMSTCRYDGIKCIDAQTNCSSYNGDSTLCQTLSDITGKGCWLADGTSGSCQDRICSNKTNSSGQKDCDSFLTGCIYDGLGCQQKQSTCSSYVNFTQDACKQVLTTTGDKCWKNTNDIGACEPISCSNLIDSPSNERCLEYNDCVFSGTVCVTKQTSCSQYLNFTVDQCKIAKKVNGDYCWATVDGTCQERLCSDYIPPVDTVNTVISNEDCLNYSSTCRLGVTNKCVIAQTACNLYGPNYSADICRQITTSTGQQCWKIDMNTVGTCEDGLSVCSLYANASQDLCRKTKDISGKQCWKSSPGVGQCEDRLCTNSILNINISNCSKHLQSYLPDTQCTYSGSGQTCILLADDCTKYVGFTQTACRETITTLNTRCWKTPTGLGNCENRICEQNVVNPSYINCNNHLSTCTFNGSTCITIQDYCSDYTNLLPEQCQTVLSNLDGKCWSQSTFMGSCVKRTCQHNLIASTDIQCEDFLTGCVTNTKGCVPKTNTCTQYSGTVSQCNSFKGCRRDDNLSGNCQIRTCVDNMDAITDVECDKFLKGCVTQGKGCISSTLPCSSYLGTKDICKNFTGNGRRCWNIDTATERTPCIDRLCSDNTYSTTDTDCDLFQYGCVTKGIGCIDKQLPCSKYFGVQATCANFRGINGLKKCWNTNSAQETTPCIDRLCTHNTKSNTDKDCNTFLDGCITKGTGCVYQQNCKNFLGTIKTCPNFSAKDKPCKGVSNIVASCVSKECYEAPNSYDTDELCEKFKTGCKTTGFGCISQDLITCENIQTQLVCQSNSQCIFTQNCKELQSDCSVYTSQSVCINTPVKDTITKRCAWHYVNGEGKCENWRCNDASENLKTHEECQALHTICTTKGTGCTEKSPCSSYSTSAVCTVAKTTDKGDYCIWDKTSCRSRKCSDASKAFRTDAKCKSYLDECLTTGQGCETPPFTCDKIVTQPRCTQDTILKPCLWQSGKCISYTSCSDFSKTTFEECQQYGEKCISDGLTCRAISLCERYLNEISCVYGTDGVCGWKPAEGTNPASCIQFKECSQAISIDSAVCQFFSNSCSKYKHSTCKDLPICISDGKQCFPQGKCETYLTQQACNNLGTDGTCFWDKDKCRLRECTDATVQNANNIVTHESCNAFLAKTKCTTNSIGCISQKICDSYDKLSCFYGTDGQCIFEKDVCRLKVCKDFKETTSDLCNTKLQGCISDGINCMSKSTCSSYITKTSCHSNGTDGVCVWIDGTTPTTPGQCKLMTKCEDGHVDKDSCLAKPKSCKYDSSTKTCTAQTCASLANGTICNPIQSFDDKKATICIANPQLTSNTTNTTSTNSTIIPPCIISEDLSNLISTTCYSYTAYTYTWNSGSSACTKCNQVEEQTNNTPTNSTNTTEEESGNLFTLMWFFLFLGQ